MASQTRLSDATDGEMTAFKTLLAKKGVDLHMLRRVLEDPSLAEWMVRGIQMNDRLRGSHTKRVLEAGNITLEEIVAFMHELTWAGLDPAKLRAAIRHKDSGTIMVEALEGHPRNRRVHEMYTAPTEVRADLETRCVANGIDLERFSWLGPEEAPEFDTDDPYTTVILTARLGTVHETCEFVWEWLAEGRVANRDSTFSDPTRYDIAYEREFKPWTLEWARVRLDTNQWESVGRGLPRPISSLHVPITRNNGPDFELLYLPLQHPGFTRARCQRTLWISGMRARREGKDFWDKHPCITFSYDGERRKEIVHLSVGYGNSSNSHTPDSCSPVYRDR